MKRKFNILYILFLSVDQLLVVGAEEVEAGGEDAEGGDGPAQEGATGLRGMQGQLTTIAKPKRESK
jgi:hypothetical protein